MERAGIDPDRHLTPAKVVRFYEPALCLLVGIPLLLILSKLLGGFLIGASVAMLFKAHIRHQRFVDAVRDRNDAMLTGQILAEMPNRTEESKQSRPFVAEVALAVELRSSTAESAPEPALPSLKTEVEETRVRIRCGGCRTTLKVKPSSAGRSAACPKCRAAIRVPLKVAG